MTVRLSTSAVWTEVATKASRGLGESFVDGWWTTDDLVGLVEGLGPRGSLRVLRSPYGHDAFLKETDRIDAILATAFRTSGESA